MAMWLGAAGGELGLGASGRHCWVGEGGILQGSHGGREDKGLRAVSTPSSCTPGTCSLGNKNAPHTDSQEPQRGTSPNVLSSASGLTTQVWPWLD